MPCHYYKDEECEIIACSGPDKAWTRFLRERTADCAAEIGYDPSLEEIHAFFRKLREEYNAQRQT